MPTAYINIATSGTPIKEDHRTGLSSKSLTGHMWYSLLKDDNAAVLESFGFAPEPNVEERWYLDKTGKVYNDDDANYESYRSFEFNITDEQYNSMKEFGKNAELEFRKYNLITKNCIDFTWEAMRIGGLNLTAVSHRPIPVYNLSSLREAQDAYEHYLDNASKILGTLGK